jgi:hypothetical protein
MDIHSVVLLITYVFLKPYICIMQYIYIYIYILCAKAFPFFACMMRGFMKKMQGNDTTEE